MKQSVKGFTLIEIIIVIVIAGVLSVITTQVITLPVKGYVDLSRRATLVDIAEMSLRRMQRDIRRALPNSVRITGGGTVLELLHIVDGGRYRAAGTGDVLDFTSADTSYDVIGTLRNFSEMDTGNDQVVIYNLGTGNSQADAYQVVNNNRAALTGATTATSVVFSSKAFPFQSPQQRFYIVDTPITYRCDIGNNTLLRYDGYAITASQPNPPGVTGQLLANHVASCSFTYVAGTGSRSALLTQEIVLTDDAGESIRLMQQVHVDNTP
jgi:MSHA biogenesis protein MshO